MAREGIAMDLPGMLDNDPRGDRLTSRNWSQTPRPRRRLTLRFHAGTGDVRNRCHTLNPSIPSDEMSLATAIPRTNVLPVPYFMQPTNNTCQSTCLKMMATYFEEQVVVQSTGAAGRDILEIWKDINESPERPVKMRNAHANMKWWLERHFPTLRFEYLTLTDAASALEKMIAFINAGMPVLVSVSHARVAGHIILVVGYENYTPLTSTPDFDLVVHDPYGRFDPSLISKSYGRLRWLGGMSLVGGGEIGPGQSCRLNLGAVGRQAKKDSRRGTYYLLSARS
jgi:hypothetical protein